MIVHCARSAGTWIEVWGRPPSHPRTESVCDYEDWNVWEWEELLRMRWKRRSLGDVEVWEGEELLRMRWKRRSPGDVEVGCDRVSPRGGGWTKTIRRNEFI